jgi:hypothetical protein
MGSERINGSNKETPTLEARFVAGAYTFLPKEDPDEALANTGQQVCFVAQGCSPPDGGWQLVDRGQLDTETREIVNVYVKFQG